MSDVSRRGFLETATIAAGVAGVTGATKVPDDLVARLLNHRVFIASKDGPGA